MRMHDCCHGSLLVQYLAVKCAGSLASSLLKLSRARRAAGFLSALEHSLECILNKCSQSPEDGLWKEYDYMGKTTVFNFSKFLRLR